MQDAQQEIHVKPPEVDPHEQLNDLLSELISQLTHFDDNLKLKLHLNLELNQQDQKIWNKHAALLQGGGPNNASTQILDQTDSFDHLLLVLQQVIGNL